MKVYSSHMKSHKVIEALKNKEVGEQWRINV